MRDHKTTVDADMTLEQCHRIRELIEADNGKPGFLTLARALPELTLAERQFALLTLAFGDYSPL